MYSGCGTGKIAVAQMQIVQDDDGEMQNRNFAPQSILREAIHVFALASGRIVNVFVTGDEAAVVVVQWYSRQYPRWYPHK